MTTMALPDPPVDTRHERSVWFARPALPGVVTPSGRRALVPVGPGVRALASPTTSGAHRDDVSGYPVQYAKVQPPPLREETLARHRLLDWLAQKIHQRIVLVLADAGYGKTTLLADFANRTRLRTLWYRLDEDDRDWISLLAHLVAAGREADPTFAPKTAALLADTSLSGPTRDDAVDVFVRELQTIAPQGAVLIFDDFHLVDDAIDAQVIAREIVANAPERLTIVFASRRAPGIPMARLRATGEVAELTTDDLRFDATETERLFRETYHRALEPDVLADVAARTEGWAASLQLVHAALRDRTPGEIRGFVRGLTGADHELYDYLAEEVVGDLPPDMQAFLMRTSILQVVTPEFSEVVTATDPATVARLTANAERATLLGRRARGPKTELRYHPLVREFLEARLAREVGEAGVRDLHRAVADHAEGRDWRIAAHHLWSAGDRSRAFDLIDGAAKGIIGRGEYLVAAPFVEHVDGEATRASFEVVLSRRDFKEGDVRRALARAERAVHLEPQSDVALANLSTLYLNNGLIEKGLETANLLLAQSVDEGLRAIAAAMLTMMSATLDGDIAASVAQLQDLARRQNENGDTHFEGITYLNLSEEQRAIGDFAASLESAERSIRLLESSSAGGEVAFAKALLGWNLVHSDDLERGRRELTLALADMPATVRVDVLLEAADAEAVYGDIGRADDHLADLLKDAGSAVEAVSRPIMITVALRRGAAADAYGIALRIDPDAMTSVTGHKTRALTLQAHASIAAGAEDAGARLDVAARHARFQAASLWIEYCAALRAAVGDEEAFARYVRACGRSETWPLTRIAELAAGRLHELSPSEVAVVLTEARRRSERWRSALRIAILRDPANALAPARLLEEIGEAQDVGLLRGIAHQNKGRSDSELGRRLARTTAPLVFVEDLGRVTIEIGHRTLEGSSIRRKVLALLCFLLSRPKSAATREEVMDALWPDYDPGDALNSLNQTIYFLRRVFEPGYKDDLSPGYVHHESDVIWLDSELLASRSQQCVAMVRAMSQEPSPSEVSDLSETYRGPFAIDFAYEDWAADYRSGLHTGYLQVVERAVASDTSSGHFRRGIAIARRALELSPDADQIELSLLRLYRLNGSHAAAAEQYAHYAAALRETFGIEPPALESL
jgi:ATP/maltotriose-dependent transcriptional regulator MalT/DNA-binding SARP family transcriptional activator